MKLTNNQKKFLRARGHTLKSIVMVGQHGLSEAVLAELESTMTKHELLKIKIRAEDPIRVVFCFYCRIHDCIREFRQKLLLIFIIFVFHPFKHFRHCHTVAGTLKSIVMVGQHGLSEAVLAELESTMTKHELLKIKIRAEDREDRQKMIDEIVNITQAHSWLILTLPAPPHSSRVAQPSQ
jgi:RNA-binding protein YhbY